MPVIALWRSKEEQQAPAVTLSNKVDVAAILSGRDARTTFLVQHVPVKYTERRVLKELRLKERPQLFDHFEYVRHKQSAFINFCDARDAVPFYQEFHKRKWANGEASDRRCYIRHAKARKAKRKESAAVPQTAPDGFDVGESKGENQATRGEDLKGKGERGEQRGKMERQRGEGVESKEQQLSIALSTDVDVRAISAGQDSRTMLMITNIPSGYTVNMLANELRLNEISSLIDSFRFRKRSQCAFISFCDARHVVPFYQEFHNRRWAKGEASDPRCHIRHAKRQYVKTASGVYVNDILSGKDKRTRFMLKNVPCGYTEDMLLEELRLKERPHLYDNFSFFESGLRAFITFCDALDAVPFYQEFHGRRWTEGNGKRSIRLFRPPLRPVCDGWTGRTDLGGSVFCPSVSQNWTDPCFFMVFMEGRMDGRWWGHPVTIKPLSPKEMW